MSQSVIQLSFTSPVNCTYSNIQAHSTLDAAGIKLNRVASFDGLNSSGILTILVVLTLSLFFSCYFPAIESLPVKPSNESLFLQSNWDYPRQGAQDMDTKPT
mmetsp:Transcript_6075/g.10542  ORF Transcript_6075/g.10542 Transcript_6075/m.10542 type:complete len:102 (+) Transcript_6075:331-636(+)